MDILGLVFPKKCIGCRKFGAYLCSGCFAQIDFADISLCGVCGKQAVSGLTHPRCKSRLSIDGIFVSLTYRGTVKRLVYQFKFDPYLSDISADLVELFYEGLIQQEMFIKTITPHVIFAPIPLHPTRERRRGYNQAEILARGLARKFDVRVKEVMSRTEKTSTQVGKTQKERRENIRGVFRLKADSDVRGSTLFLVDDVVTSGATMNEAAGVLKKAGAVHVYGVGLAHGL